MDKKSTMTVETNMGMLAEITNEIPNIISQILTEKFYGHATIRIVVQDGILQDFQSIVKSQIRNEHGNRSRKGK